MGRWIFIGIVFALIAQALGLVAYYNKRNQYSKSAQNIITVLPALVFVMLAMLGTLLFVLLVWWAEVEGLRRQIFTDSRLWLQYGVYVGGGAIANLFLSILVQLFLLMLYPPKYKTRRRRRRKDSSNDLASEERTTMGS